MDLSSRFSKNSGIPSATHKAFKLSSGLTCQDTRKPSTAMASPSAYLLSELTHCNSGADLPQLVLREPRKGCNVSATGMPHASRNLDFSPLLESVSKPSGARCRHACKHSSSRRMQPVRFPFPFPLNDQMISPTGEPQLSGRRPTDPPPLSALSVPNGLPFEAKP